MEILIAQAESFYSDNLTRLGPIVDSLVAEIEKQSAEFTGLQKRKVDSTLAIVDSFVKMEWLLQADKNSRDIIAMIPQLEFDQQRSQELSKRVPGTWVCTNKIKHQYDKSVNAVEKKVFSFSPDGSVKLVETETGKRAPTLKVNYRFESSGTYDFAGDTIHLFIDQFARKQERSEVLHMEDGKKWWEPKNETPYDSTISDGSQDRYITFGDLKSDFVKR
jgi:hypothetical protein